MCIRDSIQTVDSGTVTAKKLNSGSWELRNDYLRVIVRKDGTLSTAPAADSADPTDRQTPFCNFVTFKGSGDNKRDIVHPAKLSLKRISSVDKTLNGPAKAIKVEYDLTATVSGKTVTGTTTVYYEICLLYTSFPDAGEGEAALLGLIRPGLPDDDGVEHYHVRPLVVKGDEDVYKRQIAR